MQGLKVLPTIAVETARVKETVDGWTHTSMSHHARSATTQI